MSTRPDGIVIIAEELPGGGTGQYYDFWEELQPERVAYASDHAQMHRRYEIDGHISHSFELLTRAAESRHREDLL